MLFRSDLLAASERAAPQGDDDGAQSHSPLSLLKAEVAHDQLMSGVLADRMEGMKPKEIRRKRNLSMAQYDAVIKRLKRTAESLEKRKTV